MTESNVPARSTTTKPPAEATAFGPSAPGRLDTWGRYRARGTYDPVTVGVYVVVILLLYFVISRSSLVTNPDVIYFLMGVTLFFLLRYFSTQYWIDDTYVHARRILGSRRVPLAEIRKIEFMKLRDLSPTGFFGSWGWRGRMWSPHISKFDGIYTDPTGLLITPTEVPLFISPKDPDAFARELSRRVRSYTGPLTVDAGAP